jgi:hypothetical protein
MRQRKRGSNLIVESQESYHILLSYSRHTGWFVTLLPLIKERDWPVSLSE